MKCSLITLSGLVFLIGCSSSGQGLKEARIAEERKLEIGKTITVASQFADLPLVEPHVSAHPGENDHLLIAAMVVTDVNNPYESCRLVSFVSVDGGLAWKETVHDWWGYDPWTAIAPSGKTVMSWIGNQGSFSDYYPIRFFSSDDGGITWRDSVQVIEGNHDGTKLATLHNDVYFTTVQFRDDMGADVTLLRKNDGSEFATVGRIDGKGERLNFCEPAILSDGKVVVPYSLQDKRLWVRVFDPTYGKMGDPVLVSLRPNSRGYSRMVADNGSQSAFNNRVYHARATTEGVIINFSSDQGESWSPDTRIDLFAKAFQPKAGVVSMAVNKNGVLGVSWIESYDGVEENSFDTYFTFSEDGGASFQRPTRVTQESTSPFTSKNADVANKFPGGGHYLGLTARIDGSFQLVWSDSRSGLFELQTCNVKLAE